MVHLGILVPLAFAGMAGALWREYKKNRKYQESLCLPDSSLSVEQQAVSETLLPKPTQVFDDVGEMYHYQHVSWYTLVFATSSAWFYAPAALVSAPLLGYNTYHFIKTIRQSDPADRKSPLTLFEMIGVTASLATDQPITASLLLLLSFGTRKLLLQAGNINHIGFSNVLNPKHIRLWILRDGAEVEATISELQDGDILVMHQGDTVPVQGKVIAGEGMIRQFSLSKKMKSIPKGEGDSVFPFTLLESGCLHIQPVRI